MADKDDRNDSMSELRGSVTLPAVEVKGHLTVSSAAMTASSVSPDYSELWRELDAEFFSLTDSVIRGILDGSIPWKRVGVDPVLVEKLHQIETTTGSPGGRLDVGKAFKAFAKSHADIRKEKRLTRRNVVIALIGAAGIVAAATIAWFARGGT